MALEIVEHFLAMGWEVHVFTNLFENPIQENFLSLGGSAGLRVSSELDEEFALQFDLIWIQHSLLPNALIDELERHGTMIPIVWNHMSTMEPMEAPLRADIEAKIADTSAGNNPRVLDLLVASGIPREHCLLFDNPAPDRFGTVELPPRRDGLQSLVVISNHPPRELIDAVEILRDAGITVDIFGRGNVVEKVEPALLSRYQGVVTIGKTTQYSLSLGIPVFVYDHFGGEGWLSEENLAREAHHNFSGRSTMRVLDPQSLAKDIVSGFPRAEVFARSQHEAFAERWRLSSHISRLLADPRIVAPKKKRLSSAEAIALRTLILLQRRLFLHGENMDRERQAAVCEKQREEEISRKAGIALEEIRQSHSWRITRPLRILRGAFNR